MTLWLHCIIIVFFTENIYKNKWKGSRIQNLPSLFSILGSSITWRDSHCSGRFAEAVRLFHFEMHILPFLLQSSDLKPAIGTVSPTYSDIGLSCSPENIHSCEVTCIFCLLWGNVLVKMYYFIPRNLHTVEVHWDKLPKARRTPLDWTKYYWLFANCFFLERK